MEKNNKIMRHIKFLTEQIGKRGPTTKNEEKASKYIYSVMQKNGLEVKSDDFLSPSTFSWYYAIPCFIVFISLFIFYFNQLLGFILSIIGLFFFLTEINTIETISKIFPKKSSQNIIGILEAKRIEKKRVIIIAHHDTSKSSLSFAPKFIKYFRASIILLIFSMIFIPMIYGLLYFLSLGEIFIIVTIPFSFYLLTSVLVLIHRELVYDVVPGANDNASGVGVLLNLCETLSNYKLENTDVWFLSTGCEEVGTIGMMRFLDKYEDELSDAYFINIDNVGRGQIRYTKGEGLIKAFKCSDDLIEIVKQSASKQNINIKEFVSKIYPTNAAPCLIRKHKVISILATDEKGLIYNWHWKTDTVENLNIETIIDVYNIVMEMVKLIDKKG